MPGLGTIVNAVLVVVGGGLGLLLKKGMPERFQKIIFTATGTGVFFLGLNGALSEALTADGGKISSRWGLMLIISLVLGGLLGEALDIDGGFNRLGDKLKARFAKGGGGENAGTGFVTASIIFCAGAMSIIGSMEDAAGNPSTLYVKGMLDAITALVFTTVYGFGVLFAAVSVLVYQGAITLLALWLTPYIPPEIISQMSMVGSAVLMLIAFSLWDIKSFKVANLIPAMFMPILLYWIPFFR